MRLTKLLLALSAIGFAASAHATNGMNLEGYGPIATGMGGASMAYDNGTAAVMNNPATLGMMDSAARLDIAVGMLGPDVTAKAGPLTADSDGDAYYMPAVGYARKSGQFTYGVAMFAQGGMGTEYSGASFMSAGSGLPTRSELGVGRLIAPLTYQVNPDLTIGGSVDFVWAMMDLQMALTGAQFLNMAGMPIGGPANSFGQVGGNMMTAFNNTVGAGVMNPLNPVNWGYFDFSNDNDYTGKTKATGLAGKIGFTYKINPKVTIGGVYHSKTSLGDMDGGAMVSFNANVDNGLLGGTWNGVPVGAPGNFGAPAGTYTPVTIPVSGKIKVVDFQWPETIGLGMAIQATDRLLVAVDYKRINWADVMKNFNMTFVADAAQANPFAGGFAGTTLSATMFQNWDDQDVLQLGFSYKATDQWTLRAGVNIANNPIPDNFMNPLFPAIEENHVTLGAGYAFDKNSSVDFALQVAPEVSQTNGSGVTVDHSQLSWQFMYSKRF